MFGLFSTLFAIGTAIVAGARRAVTTVRDVFREQVGRAVEKTVETVFTELDTANAKIASLNDRVEDLEQKLSRDGKLSSSDDDELYSLRSVRIFHMQAWGNLNAERVALESRGESRGLITIDQQSIHIAEGHVGLTSLNRHCRMCRRMLVLRRNRQSEIASFFWGCPAFFDAPPLGHKYSERFETADLKLVAEKSIEDWQTPRGELQRAVDLMSRDVEHRVSEHVQQKIDQIICGTHAEPMVLHKRREPVPLLDLYYLSCPRMHCQYTVKIASIGQLTSLLTASEGRGIL